MLENYEWWSIDCGDTGTFEISTKEMDAILQAEKSGSRFILLDGIMLNIAFIRGAKRVRKSIRNEAEKEEFNLMYPNRTKFLTENSQQKWLSS